MHVYTRHCCSFSSGTIALRAVQFFECNAKPRGVFLQKCISPSSMFLTVTCVGCSVNESKMEDVFKAIFLSGIFCLLLAASSSGVSQAERRA